MFTVQKHTVHRLGQNVETLVAPKFEDYSEAERFIRALNLEEQDSRVYYTTRQE